MCRLAAAGCRLQALSGLRPDQARSCSLQPAALSLRARFTLYLIVVHALLASAGCLFLRQNRLWLFAVEVVFVASLATGVTLVRRMFRRARLRRRQRAVPERQRLHGALPRSRTAGDRSADWRLQPHGGQPARRAAARAGAALLSRRASSTSRRPASSCSISTRASTWSIPRRERLLQRPAEALRGPDARVGERAAARRRWHRWRRERPRHRRAGGRRVRVQRGTFLDRGFSRSFFLLEELTEELRQSEKAAYEKLIRMMSHEVNNSVGASSSLLQSSLSYSAQLSRGDRADFERALQIAIDRMGQLNLFMRSFADVVRLPAPARQPVGSRGDAAPYRGARARRSRCARHRLAVGASTRILPCVRWIPCRWSRRS